MATKPVTSPQPKTAGEMVAMARNFLERKGADEARLEADLLVGFALGLDRLRLLMQLDRPVTGEEIDRARDLLVRRGRREPVAYIIGEREFYGRPFTVAPGVLVPRPETELLVDLARDHQGDRSGARVLDLGTGSGCLAITLALELTECHVVAVDVSEPALAIARENGARHGLGPDRIEFVLGDGLEVAAGHAPFDVIVSNPPYVDPAVRDTLAAEVRDHEPAEALFAPGDDPDFWARELYSRAGSLLAPEGALFVELGFDQAERLRTLEGARFEKDLAGIERVLALSCPSRGATG